MNRYISGLTLAASLALVATGAFAQTTPMASNATTTDSMKAQHAKPDAMKAGAAAHDAMAADTMKAAPATHDAMAADAMKAAPAAHDAMAADAMATDHMKKHTVHKKAPAASDHMSTAPAPTQK